MRRVARGLHPDPRVKQEIDEAWHFREGAVPEAFVPKAAGIRLELRS